MKKPAILFALALSLLVAGDGLGQSFYGGSIIPGLAVPPAGTGSGVCATPTASNTTTATITVPANSGTIADVNLRINMTHTFIADLSFTLTHGATSVIVYAEASPGTGNDLVGTYTWDDEAGTTWVTAVTGAGPNVTPGTYSPVNPLSAFDGAAAAGTWTLTICDNIGGDLGTLSALCVEITPTSESFGGAVGPIAMGDGNGTCLAPIVVPVNVPSSFTIGDVDCQVGITHTFVSDLRIYLVHQSGPTFTAEDSTVVTIYDGVPGCGANLAGNYVFDDEAATAFVSACPVAIAAGSFRPDGSLSDFDGQNAQGPWYLVICDTVGIDVGSVTNFTLTFQRGGWSYTISQTGPGAAMTFSNSGGHAGNQYLNIVTLAPNNFPHGWLNGLDPDIFLVLAEIGFGPPFFGNLGPCGDATTTTLFGLGAIPGGVTIQTVGIEFSPAGMIQTSLPFAYTTL